MKQTTGEATAEEPTVDEEAEARMRYGTVNEPNAVATLVQVVLPLCFPDLRYREEGMATYEYLASSGDGSLVAPNNPDEICELLFTLVVLIGVFPTQN